MSRGSYADTVLHEVRLAADVLGDGDARATIPPVTTIFFGGGTPTLLPAEHLGLIIGEIAERFGLAADVEITTEANPETVTPGYFAKLREAGFTRVSLGMQSAVPRVLEVLDRRHRPGRPEAAVAEAHAAGFEHVNLDLIYGAPYETDADWQRSLDAAVAAGPDHISAYALVVEAGHRAGPAGRRPASCPPVDDDVLADRYVHGRRDALRRPATTGTRCRTGRTSDAARCRHNELYWTDDNWWGFGPGAHSHVSGVRWWNVKHPARYTAMLEAGRQPGRRPRDPRRRRAATPSGSCSACGCATACRPTSSPTPARGVAAAAGRAGAWSTTAPSRRDGSC